MDDFYETLLKDVQQKMQEQNYEEAKALLDEEFRMPYIPKEYEEKMIALYNTCYHECKAAKKTQRKYDEEDIETLLKGSIDEACQAVDLLKGSNIRTHLPEVEAYLSDNPHFLIRSLLVEALVEQQVNEEINLVYDDLEVSFVPAYVEMPQQQETLVEAIKMVSDFYENENPTFLMMCVEIMMKEAYFKLPFSLDEDEVKPFVYAVLEYVYKANGDMEGFTRFIHEKNLAKYRGYGLLLCRYEF